MLRNILYVAGAVVLTLVVLSLLKKALWLAFVVGVVAVAILAAKRYLIGK